MLQFSFMIWNILYYNFISLPLLTWLCMLIYFSAGKVFLVFNFPTTQLLQQSIPPSSMHLKQCALSSQTHLPFQLGSVDVEGLFRRVKQLGAHGHLLFTFWTLPWVILATVLHFLAWVPVLWGHTLRSSNWVQTTQQVTGLCSLGWPWVGSFCPVCYSSLTSPSSLAKPKPGSLAHSPLAVQVERKTVIFPPLDISLRWHTSHRHRAAVTIP